MLLYNGPATPAEQMAPELVGKSGQYRWYNDYELPAGITRLVPTRPSLRRTR